MSKWLEWLRWPTSHKRSSGQRLPLSLVIIGLSLLYLLTASRTVQGGDTGEYITVAFSGGVPHPPGYPLYVLLTQSISWVPLINPAYTLSLISAIFALLTAAALYAAIRRWGLSAEAALLSIVTVSLSPLFWRYAGVPEVFTLNTLLAAFLLWASGRGEGPSGHGRAALIGLLLGLGLCNHHTIVLLAPIAAIGLIRAVRERPSRALSILLTSLVCLVLGLSPYLTLLGRDLSTGAWLWGGTLGLPDLIAHFLRQDYGTTDLGVLDMQPSLFENPGALGLNLLSTFHLLSTLVLLGVAVSVVSLRRLHRLEDDALDSAGLLGSTLLILVFFAMFNLRPEGLASAIIERFYLLPLLPTALLLSAGIDRLLDSRPVMRPFFHYLTAGVFSISAIANISAADWSRETAVEDYVYNALDSVPPGSVIIGTGDIHFSFLTMSEVYGLRLDVVYIDLHLLRYQWYYDRVARRLPEFEVPFDPDTTRLAAVILDLQRQHPVFIADLPEAEELFSGPHFFTYPVGPLLGVVTASEDGSAHFPQPSELETLNRALFDRMLRRGETPKPNTWGAYVFRHYRRTWDRMSELFVAHGDSPRAEAMQRIGESFSIEEEREH